MKLNSPMFGTVLLDCDVVVYLDIEDDVLKEHCRKRDVNFEDAKRMKQSIDDEWEKHRIQDEKKIYYFLLKE